MSSVIFTLQKLDGTLVQLEYIPFNTLHSDLWIRGLLNSNKILWNDRVYNLVDPIDALNESIYKCNHTIEQINSKYSQNISKVNSSNLQSDINYVHTFFVDSVKCELWHKLNYQLHAIEILNRNKSKKLQGQAFVELDSKVHYDIPLESFSQFTTRKKFGYCYANYSHIGRHIFEMYNAKDEEAHDDHIIPMHKISGSSCLWFGETTNWFYNKFLMLKIKQWFIKNNIHMLVNMPWGDTRLAIGWLPVAKLKTKISLHDLIGCTKVVDVTVHEQTFYVS